MLLCVRNRIWELVHGRAGKIWEYMWGLEIRTCWLSVDWKGKWYLGAGKSYLGGPRGLEIRISGVFSGPSGGKSFLGGGKSYWGALWRLENRTSRAVWPRCWKLVLGSSPREWIFELVVGAGKSYLGWCWVLENRTCGFVGP